MPTRRQKVLKSTSRRIKMKLKAKAKIKSKMEDKKKHNKPTCN